MFLLDKFKQIVSQGRPEEFILCDELITIEVFWKLISEPWMVNLGVFEEVIMKLGQFIGLRPHLSQVSVLFDPVVQQGRC